MSKIIQRVTALGVIVSVAVAACNGGGGSSTNGPGSGSNSGPALTSKTAGHAAIAAVTAATGAMLVGANASGGGAQAPRLARAEVGTRLTANLQTTRAAAVVVQGPTTTNCTVSGTTTSTTSTNNNNETVSTKSFAACVDNASWTDDSGNSIAAHEYRNGTVAITYSNTSDTIVLGDSNTAYTDRYTRASSDSAVLKEDVSTLTLVASSTLSTTCTNDSATSSFSINGSFSHKKDGNADGKYDDKTHDENSSGTLTGLKLDTSDTYNSSCVLTNESSVMNGKIVATDAVDATNSGSFTISSADPLKFSDTYNGALTSSTISGTITVDSKCGSGTVKIATVTPVVQANNAPCPTSGQLSITGDATATITFNSDGSVDVGGTHYATCDAAGTCS